MDRNYKVGNFVVHNFEGRRCVGEPPEEIESFQFAKIVEMDGPYNVILEIAGGRFRGVRVNRALAGYRLATDEEVARVIAERIAV